jgi:hypothetical protein
MGQAQMCAKNSGLTFDKFPSTAVADFQAGSKFISARFQFCMVKGRCG